ncbi:MAG: PTS glucitol/sorbitol transporter subunit IIA [Alphaproteobacteria bacterium]|nr:PTS glucitol/sorbitol transporter subunit IIA [Alphaproteobacteria bacterium]
MYLQTVITGIGPEVADMAEGGVVILFADGAPPELAEVSVLHKTVEEPSAKQPPVGAAVRIGSIAVKITGIGPTAWAKMTSMGHIVFAFNGGDASDRPGEICVTEVPLAELLGQLKAGIRITVG